MINIFELSQRAVAVAFGFFLASGFMLLFTDGWNIVSTKWQQKIYKFTSVVCMISAMALYVSLSVFFASGLLVVLFK